MEFHGVHRVLGPDHLAEEKQQMLHLNRRLETYMNRVKLLEEENTLLAKEIQATRRNSRGAQTHRRSLEEEVQRARLEVEAAWRDRLMAELEVGKLAEELQALDLQTRWEAQATMRAKAKLEQSRKELEEEQRAEVWLRERVGQLEHEMRLLVQTHQDAVARLEAQVTHARVGGPRTPAQRAKQTPSLLQLGQDYSQRAARAWQEAAEAHRGQLARLEESLHQAGARLTQVEQEKRQNQLKLQALEKEMASAQDVRQHLEKAAAQQKDAHRQEVQQLHERSEELEAEKEEIGRQMEHLLLENQGLLQMKASLGLEVATYRALLDGEGFRADVRRLNQPPNISIADAVFSPRGVKKNYQTQLPASHKTTSFQSISCITGPTVTSVTPTGRRKPAAPHATPAAPETPYPKILQGEAVESFRPQQVHEKITHAEPLSPSDEHQATEPGSGEEEKLQNDRETPAVESVVTPQVESGVSKESFNDEPCGDSGKSGKKVAFQGVDEEEDTPPPHAPVDAWVEKQEECSDSETEAMLEPTWESRTSSPESECVSEEMVTEFNLDENVAEMRQKAGGSAAGRSQADDKLYPDGEEMDTWDSVIERKADLKTGEGMKSDKGQRQRAEPEEDISEQKKGEFRKPFVGNVQQEAPSQMVPTQVDHEQLTVLERECAAVSDKDEDDDSQNVSVSWRTELESDSYAQDNTLADTRPLIRYQSDEADANAQASHVEESESSEGEEDRKVKEVGMGTWTEDKSKRFGTMEDLCEEIEGEMADEQCSLGYVQTEEVDAGHGSAAWQQPTVMSDTGNAEHMVRQENEKQSEVETEKLICPINIDYDEELETDRLVEQELEDLTTDSYSVRFAEREVTEEMRHDESVQEITTPQDGEETEPEHLHGVQSDKSMNEGLVPCSAVTSQTSEKLHSTRHKDQEPPEITETMEQENELGVSSVTRGDETETQSGFTDSKSSFLTAAGQKNNPDVTDHGEVEEAAESASKEQVKYDQEFSDNLQEPRQGNAAESEEPQEQAEVEGYQELSGSMEQPQRGNKAEASKQPRERLAGDAARSEEPPDTLRQPQHDSTMEASGKRPDQPLQDGADINMKSVQQPAKGVVCQEAPLNSLKQPEASEERRGEAVDGAEERQQLSSSPQKSQSRDQSEESEESQEQLYGRPPDQPPLGDFMEEIEESEDELEEEVPDCWEFSSSFDSQADNLRDKSKEAPDELLQDDVDCQEDLLMEVLKRSEEPRTEDGADGQDFPEAPGTAEQEVFHIQDQAKSHQKSELVAKSNDEEQLETSSDRVPAERDIFTLKDATESRLSDFSPAGVKSDFWVSSLESGATFQPAAAAAAEHTDRNTGLPGNVTWGTSEKQNGVNGNSKPETAPYESRAAKKDEKQKQREVKQAPCRNVLEEDLLQSEESEEEEGGSWSSEE